MKRNLKLKKNRVFTFIIMMFLFTTGLKIENLNGFETSKPEPKLIYHYVNSNETIWNIADKYNCNMDKRDYVDTIIKLNNNSSRIRQGEIISIPIYR